MWGKTTFAKNTKKPLFPSNYKQLEFDFTDETKYNRINDLETLMNDTDKDGVPDYLDVENNSITGVAVDTKGRMIDVNKNGVPDELEKLIQNITIS